MFSSRVSADGQNSSYSKAVFAFGNAVNRLPGPVGFTPMSMRYLPMHFVYVLSPRIIIVLPAAKGILAEEMCDYKYSSSWLKVWATESMEI